MKFKAFVLIGLLVYCLNAIETIGIMPIDLYKNSSMVSGDFYYSFIDKEILIYDISNPENSFLTNTIETDYPIVEIILEEDYLFVAQIPSVYEWPAQPYYLEIFDVHDVNDPIFIGSNYSHSLPDNINITDNYLTFRQYGFTNHKLQHIYSIAESIWFRTSDILELHFIADDVAIGAKSLVNDLYRFEFSGTELVSETVIRDLTRDHLGESVYVDDSYLYVLNHDFLFVFDASDPLSPSLIVEMMIPDSIENSFFSNSVMYIKTESDFLIVDLNDPYIMETNRINTEAEMIGIDSTGNFVYLCDTNLYIVDVSDPEFIDIDDTIYINFDFEKIQIFDDKAYCHTKYTGLKTFNIDEYSETEEVMSFDYMNSPDNFYLNGDYAYATDYPYLHIIDVYNPEQLKILNSIQPYDSVRAMHIDNDHLFIMTKNCGIYIYNIDEPGFPSIISHISITAYDCNVENDTLFVYGYDLRLFDISHISSPTEIGIISSFSSSYEKVIFANSDNIYTISPHYIVDRLHIYELYHSEPLLTSHIDFSVLPSRYFDFHYTSGMKKWKVLDNYIYTIFSHQYQIGSHNTGIDNYLCKINITDLNNVYIEQDQIVSHYDNDYFDYERLPFIYGLPKRIEYKDEKIFIADSRKGLLIYDDDSTSMDLIDTFYNEIGYLEYYEAIDMYIDNDYVYYMDNTRGFQILDLSTLSISEDLEPATQPDTYNLTVSPNPFNSAVRIDCENESPVEILDITGKVVHTMETGNVWVPNVDVNSGVYIIRQMDNRSVCKNVIYLK